jgi:hypothetical protein
LLVELAQPVTKHATKTAMLNTRKRFVRVTDFKRGGITDCRNARSLRRVAQNKEKEAAKGRESETDTSSSRSVFRRDVSLNKHC